VEIAVALAGLVAEGAAWWSVATRRARLWSALPGVLAVMAIVAVIIRPPIAAADVRTASAAAVGAISGIALYGATRAFVAIAAGWGPFRRATVDVYAYAAPVPFALALALSILVVVPAEEIFWRGLVQPRMDELAGPAAAAVTTWLAYVVANVPSRSVPIVLGAAVGGAVWAGLAWWSGGVLASFASHILWTGLMLGWPPAPGREGVRA
jgi:uncharacterized protein